jgi:hypothetical protein
VGTAVVVRRLNQLFLVGPDGRAGTPIAWDRDDGRLLGSLEGAIRTASASADIHVDTGGRCELLARSLAVRGVLATIDELRTARTSLPVPSPGTERPVLLATAGATLERVLASPEEILISLAREEERLERAVGREARAADAFLIPKGSALDEYASAWASVREMLERHHAGLVGRARRHAESVAPNLSRVVGPGVAARLVAAAGGLQPLARMRAPRLQLLGSRRRPSPDRGPRYGILYRAERMSDVPADRRGAYARSLAALASIAARADATTRGDVAGTLVARRDRRVEQLRRRSR